MRVLLNCIACEYSQTVAYELWVENLLYWLFFFVKIGLNELAFKLEALKTNVFNSKWIDLVYFLDVIAVTEEER